KSQSKRDEPRVSVQRVEQAGYRNLAAGSRRGAKEAGNDRSNSQDQRRNGTPVDPIGIRISALGIKQAGEVQVLSANYPIITDKNTGNSAHQTGIADEPREDIGAHRLHDLPRHHQYTDDGRDQAAPDIGNEFGIQIRKIVGW